MKYYICGSCGWDSREEPDYKERFMGFCPECQRDSLDVKEGDLK